MGCICLVWHCVLSGFYQLGYASTLEWEVLAVWDVLPPLTWFLVAGSGDPSLVLSTEHKTGVRFLMPLVIRQSSYTFERINRKWWWHSGKFQEYAHLTSEKSVEKIPISWSANLCFHVPHFGVATQPSCHQIIALSTPSGLITFPL